nr:uncharacterized protein LOC128679063 isoform X2 [Plodia interpunctella]XP_053617008.1 uncharacterized protein LOC128679063 isoform X2 [Plodia interpunctella]
MLCITVHSAPQDSDITYVKIQPLNIDAQPIREPRIDQISDQSNHIQNTTEKPTSPGKVELTTPIIDSINEHIDPSLINKLNRISTDDPNRPTYLNNQTENKTPENPYRFIRSDVSFETTTDAATENVPTIQYTKTPLQYLSKLSYYKSTASYGGSDVNLVERTGKRGFKSKCRCEKIWNCPKLQITVPRCPNEYFLCCF